MSNLNPTILQIATQLVVVLVVSFSFLLSFFLSFLELVVFACVVVVEVRWRPGGHLLFCTSSLTVSSKSGPPDTCQAQMPPLWTNQSSDQRISIWPISASILSLSESAHSHYPTACTHTHTHTHTHCTSLCSPALPLSLDPTVTMPRLMANPYISSLSLSLSLSPHTHTHTHTIRERERERGLWSTMHISLFLILSTEPTRNY